MAVGAYPITLREPIRPFWEPLTERVRRLGFQDFESFIFEVLSEPMIDYFALRPELALRLGRLRGEHPQNPHT